MCVSGQSAKEQLVREIGGREKKERDAAVRW